MTSRAVAAFKPLAGVRVFSLAEQYPGPLCAQLLADLGAEVTQLERPERGDPAREMNPWLFRATNTKRRSVAADLKTPAGINIAMQLAKRSHIFLEGYRPGVVKRLGLDYEKVREAVPGIVYCSISGVGQDGPDSQSVGHNINYEASTGLLHGYASGDLDLESYFAAPVPLGDVLAGCIAALGVTAALRGAERTGVGTYLDLSITEALLVAMIPDITRSLNTEEGVHHYDAGYGLFATADGLVALGIAHEEPFWRALCEALDLPELLDVGHEARVRRRAELRSQLQDRLRCRTTDQWLTAFGPDVPATAVRTMRDVSQVEQLVSRGMFTDAHDENGRAFRTVNTPFSRGRVAPYAVPKVERLGESTREVLQELGLQRH